MLSYTNSPSIISFGLAKFYEIWLGIVGSTASPRISASSCDFLCSSGQSNFILNLNKWYHVAFSFTTTTGIIYIDSVSVFSFPILYFLNKTATRNFIGASNSILNSNPNAVYDDIQIYSGALSSADILNNYLDSSNNGL